MLSYQHGYHAGNFADVIKHLTLSLTLDYLRQKDKPLLYLDTHAGTGLYNLDSTKAQKTKEYQEGIALIWNQKQKLPDVFKPYINAITSYNNGPLLNIYPGSPAIAISMLRPMDRLILCDAHPREYAKLLTLPTQGRKLYRYHEDGYTRLKGALPPEERRALVVIDPPYEVLSDYKMLPGILEDAIARFATGTYLLWYPLLSGEVLSEQMIKKINRLNPKNTLNIQWRFKETAKNRMVGTGIWILNPPYTLKNDMQQALSTLKEIYSKHNPLYAPEFSVE